MEARGRPGRVIVVLDVSIAAAWLLLEEDSDAAEALVAGLSGRSPVPSLFWHEARNILAMAERRGRIVAGEAAAAMGRLRRLPLEDAGAGSDGGFSPWRWRTGSPPMTRCIWPSRGNANFRLRPWIKSWLKRPAWKALLCLGRCKARMTRPAGMVERATLPVFA